MLPLLSAMGVEVVDERPYGLEDLPRPSHIYDFGLRYGTGVLPANARELFQDTVLAVWEGRNESDGFNALVLAVGLTWRQALLLRAYARHMRQGGTPFAQDYIEDALRINRRHHPAAGAALRGSLRPRTRPVGSPPTASRARRSAPTSRSGSPGRSTTSPASTTTGSCGPT